MNTVNQLFKKVDDELAIVIDNMLKIAAPQLDADKSPQQIAQARAALSDFLGAKEVRNRAAQGLSIIFRELDLHATPVQVANIKAEWDKNTKALTAKMEPGSSTIPDLKTTILEKQAAGNTGENNLADETSPSFQDIFPLSDTTIEHFYQCGYRLHQNAQYQDAADVFFVMSSMDYRRHNVWMALGLAEKALNHWDLALTAFSMAILTNMQEPLAFLHSAACYIALGTKTDAQECLQAARELLVKLPNDQAQPIRNYLSALEKLI